MSKFRTRAACIHTSPYFLSKVDTGYEQSSANLVAVDQFHDVKKSRLSLVSMLKSLVFGKW